MEVMKLIKSKHSNQSNTYDQVKRNWIEWLLKHASKRAFRIESNSRLTRIESDAFDSVRDGPPALNPASEHSLHDSDATDVKIGVNRRFQEILEQYSAPTRHQALSWHKIHSSVLFARAESSSDHPRDTFRK
jgi:hypothetical protein